MPPNVRFLTKIYHPNVDKLGRICLSTLKSMLNFTRFILFWCTNINKSEDWSPALQIRTVLLSIQALMGAPNPDDPLDNDVAKIWKENEPQAIANAREWTKKYAV